MEERIRLRRSILVESHQLLLIGSYFFNERIQLRLVLRMEETDAIKVGANQGVEVRVPFLSNPDVGEFEMTVCGSEFADLRGILSS